MSPLIHLWMEPDANHPAGWVPAAASLQHLLEQMDGSEKVAWLKNTAGGMGVTAIKTANEQTYPAA